MQNNFVFIMRSRNQEYPFPVLHRYLCLYQEKSVLTSSRIYFDLVNIGNTGIVISVIEVVPLVFQFVRDGPVQSCICRSYSTLQQLQILQQAQRCSI